MHGARVRLLFATRGRFTQIKEEYLIFKMLGLFVFEGSNDVEIEGATGYKIIAEH